MRAQVELLSKQQGVWLGQDAQGALDSKMEVEEEMDCKETWTSQRKVYSGSCGTFRSLRAWTRFSGTERRRDRQKESWKEELQEIERKRTELLPEHQKLQKRSQKVQRLQDTHVKKECKCSVGTEGDF